MPTNIRTFVKTCVDRWNPNPVSHILGEASDAHGAVELARRSKPDILLVDFALSQRVELKALIDAAKSAASVRIVVTISGDREGPPGGSLQAWSSRRGAERIDAPGVCSRVFEASWRANTGWKARAWEFWWRRFANPWRTATGTKSPKDYGLTRREVDIITKIASGRSNKEVGEEFAISERTVKHHLTNIFGKVGVSSRLQLALFAVNQHFMSSPAPSLTLQPMHLDDDV